LIPAGDQSRAPVNSTDFLKAAAIGDTLMLSWEINHAIFVPPEIAGYRHRIGAGGGADRARGR
jgi:hypothetical protein